MSYPMVLLMIDQAQSLRELMSQRKRKALHYVAITGGARGVGKTSFAFNLALFLQQAGKRPLVVQVVEQQELPDNAGLVQALRNKKDLPDLVLADDAGINYLPQSDLLGLSGFDASLVRNSLLQLDSLADLIIFDAEGNSSALRRLLAASHDTFILITAEKDALLGGYALLKQLGGDGHKGSLQVVLNKAASSQQADVILESFAATTARHTDLQISQSSFIRRDETVARAGGSKAFAARHPDGPAARDMALIAEKFQVLLAADRRPVEPGKFLDEFLKEA